MANLCELLEPLVFVGDVLQEGLLLLQTGSFLFVLEHVDALVVLLFVFLPDFLLAFDESALLFFGKLSHDSRSPLDVEDVLLEGILGDDFSNEVPNLVSLFSAQQNEATRVVNVEEVHSAHY